MPLGLVVGVTSRLASYAFSRQGDQSSRSPIPPGIRNMTIRPPDLNGDLHAT